MDINSLKKVRENIFRTKAGTAMPDNMFLAETEK